MSETDRCTVLAIGGGVWATASVEQQPSLTMEAWTVRELKNGDRHFVGYVLQNREGRVSSKVLSFDSARMRGVTATGRVYQLAGKPGHDSDAEYVWNSWLRRYSLEPSDWADVTAEVWPPESAA